MIRWDSSYDEQVRAMSGADLLAAYQRTSSKPGDQDGHDLLAEIERRNLDAG
jgi:hypothetical protein